MQADGIYIGSSDFDHLPRTNLVACAACATMLWWIKTNALGLQWVWWSMALFFFVRLSQHVLHAAMHYNRSAFGRYVRPDNKIVHVHSYENVGQDMNVTTPRLSSALSINAVVHPGGSKGPGGGLEKGLHTLDKHRRQATYGATLTGMNLA